MQLSKRLTALAAMVSTGNRLADVGTDHGYVPIYLYREKRIPGAIAMDINRGPLERAKAHIQEYGCTAAIETRLSDGCRALKAGEADTVLIAGMGGGLVKRILEEGSQVLASVSELILQPQSEIAEVRRFLYENGYHIIEEDFVIEDGKYYPMMKAVHGKAPMPEGGELLYGKRKLQKHPEARRQFLLKEQRKYEQILQQLSGSEKQEHESRSAQVLKSLALVKALLAEEDSGVIL